MRIMICGSMSFIKDIVKTKKYLEKLGHESIVMRPVILNGELERIE